MLKSNLELIRENEQLRGKVASAHTLVMLLLFAFAFVSTSLYVYAEIQHAGREKLADKYIRAEQEMARMVRVMDRCLSRESGTDPRPAPFGPHFGSFWR